MSGLIGKIFRHARRRLIDGPRGLGHPVPAAAFDREYASGHWDLLFSPGELPRNAALVARCLAVAAHPAVLDIGCGSGRLAQLLTPHGLKRYLGLDLSTEGLARARALGLAGCEFTVGDFETWRPPSGETFDVIVFNESIGYARDPGATVAAFAPFVRPGGVLLISYFRSGNYAAIWRRLAACFPTLHAETVSTDPDHVWDIRVLAPTP